MALIPVHRRVARFWPAFFGGVFLFCAFAAVVIIAYKASLPGKTVEYDRAESRRQKLAALRAAIREGLDSGPAEPFDMEGKHAPIINVGRMPSCACPRRSPTSNAKRMPMV